MALPANFSMNPGEESHHYFRNVCIDFRKALKSTKDQNLLGQQIERFKSASKQINWHHHKKSDVYRKNPGDKLATKVIDEYNRYAVALTEDPQMANPQDLLDALSLVEGMLR